MAMSIYYDEIHRRANFDKWKDDLRQGRVTFEEWKAHWLAVAEDWRVRCEDKGLKETANHIASIIRLNK